MDTQSTRTGAAISPDRRYDRSAIDRRLRALTVGAALAGAAGVAGFGLIASQGGTQTASTAVVTTDAAQSTSIAVDGTAAATAEPVLQAAPVQVSGATGAGEVTTGGSTQ